jgi:hypothetical protein
MANRHGQPGGGLSLKGKGVDRGNEAAEGDDAGRAWPACAEAKGVGHHGSLGEAAEHCAGMGDVVLREEPVQPWGGGLERGVKGVVVGKADLAHDVPVGATRRQGQRPAQRRPEQPLLGIEHVEQGVEIVLVGAATVKEDQRALGVAGGGAKAMLHVGLMSSRRVEWLQSQLL